MSTDVVGKLQLTENFITPIRTINNTSPDENGNFNVNEYDISVKDGRLCINKIGGDE